MGNFSGASKYWLLLQVSSRLLGYTSPEMQSVLSRMWTKASPIWPTSYWPGRCCLNCHTYFSSGSSFSSFVGVILTPPFLARGQPDKLKYVPKKEQNKTMWFLWPLLQTLISFFRNEIHPTFCGKHSSQSHALNHHTLGLDTWKTQEQSTGLVVVVGGGGSRCIQIEWKGMSRFLWDVFLLKLDYC